MQVLRAVAMSGLFLAGDLAIEAAEPETFLFARADDELVRHSEGSAVEL